MFFANLRRTIVPALAAVAWMTLPSAPLLSAQVGGAPSRAMSRLYLRYFEQAASHPDSALVTLHAILAESSATRADTTKVARFAAVEAASVGGLLRIALVGADTRSYELDTLAFDDLRLHADSLAMAIGYETFADSIAQPDSSAATLIGLAYFDRTLTQEAVARRTGDCSDWRVFLDDAVRLMEGGSSVPAGQPFELLPPYRRRPPSPVTPQSLTDYAASMVNARCRQPAGH